MNKFIKDQLENCKVANIPEYSDNTLHLIIKGVRSHPELVVGKYYEIKLADYVVNPPPDFNLATNWNNGTTPPSANMNVEVVELLGAKMVKISGTGDNKLVWHGWVPKKSILSFKEI